MGQVAKPVVLITGASSGIGLACARYLADRGYRVFGTSRRPEAYPAEPFPLVQMDVCDDESVRRGVEVVLQRAGRIDVLVNNAGIGYGGAIEDTSLEEAHQQFETNFFGALRLCRAVLPIMRQQGGGLIVNVSSIGGLMGLPFQGLYSAAKFALEGMSEALRLEVRRFGIRVVLIEPGDTRTGFTTHRRRVRASFRGSAYAEPFKRALAVVRLDERHGASPLSVARQLERIIRSRSPRFRYVVASPVQRLAVWVKRYGPDRLMEWALRKYYRID